MHNSVSDKKAESNFKRGRDAVANGLEWMASILATSALSCISYAAITATKQEELLPYFWGAVGISLVSFGVGIARDYGKWQSGGS